MAVVINLLEPEVHEPLYLFSDGKHMYFVNATVHEGFMDEDRESHRMALADIVVHLDTREVVKSRYF